MKLRVAHKVLKTSLPQHLAGGVTGHRPLTLDRAAHRLKGRGFAACVSEIQAQAIAEIVRGASEEMILGSRLESALDGNRSIGRHQLWDQAIRQRLRAFCEATRDSVRSP